MASSGTTARAPPRRRTPRPNAPHWLNFRPSLARARRLPQRSRKASAKGEDDRTVEEKATFGRGLKGINEFYGARKTTVLLVDTELPPGPKTNCSKQYLERGWCLMECMFADCSKVPRFKFTTRRHLTEARNELLELRPDMRLENKKPEEGNFTVEADREIMKVLTFMAQVITHKLDRGGSFGLLDAKDFEEKGMLRGQSVEEIVKEDSKVKRGESLDARRV